LPHCTFYASVPYLACAPSRPLDACGADPMASIITLSVLFVAAAVDVPSTCTGDNCGDSTFLLQMEQGILSHRAIAEETNTNLRNLFESLKNGKEDAIDVDKVTHLVHSVASAQHVEANISLSDVTDLAEMIDRNDDGKLDFKEMKDILYPKFVGKEDNSTDDEYPAYPASTPNDTLFLQDGTVSSGTWQDYTCCSDYYGRRYNQPRWFKPRVEYDGDTYTVKLCYLVSFIFNDGCWGYFYTNANGAASGGMCRCYPSGSEYWHGVHPLWSVWASSSGNHIYYNPAGFSLR